jgi:hypothetical protein
MKTHLHKLFALLLTVMAFTSAQATDKTPKDDQPAEESKVVALEKFAYSVYSIKDKTKFRLAFENQDAQQVVVRIFDNRNRLVHTDRLKRKTALKRDYNLSEVGKGQYRMDIRCGEFTASNTLYVGMQPVAGKFDAYLSHSLKQGKMQIAFQNATEDVYVTLTDANGVIHYSEHLVDSPNFARRYDLSRLRPGEYTMSVTMGDKTMEQTYRLGQ